MIIFLQCLIISASLTPNIVVSATSCSNFTNVVGFTWSYDCFLNTPDFGFSH